MVRAAVLKGKDPQQLVLDLQRIDEMEYNVQNPPPLSEKVLRDKRKKLRETWDRVLRLYQKEDPEHFSELKKMELEYEDKRNTLIKYYESVKFAQSVEIDQIPLPSAPSAPHVEPPSNKVEKPAEDKAEKTGASKPRKIRFADEGPDRPPGVDDDADVTEFLKEDRSKSKIKPSPEGSPLRDDAKTSVNKSRTRDAKKTNEDDVWGALQRAQDEPAAWSLKELRERLTVPWVLKHQGHLKQALEEALRRPRLAHDARHELTACLSAFGTLLGDRAREFVEWTMDVYDLSIPDESRILLLKALLEASGLTVMARAQTMLEGTDDCELLLAAAALSLWAAEQDPDAFAASHFHDTVDILVGWHIDASSPALARRTGKTLEALAPFWVADPAFCATLLGQFVEDLEAYADDLSQTVMARAQTMLEGTDDCELLLAAAALSLWAAEQDPDAFAASHFHDTVDILVGWHIDASSPALARRTGKTLEALAPFWVADPAFCATLLGQFVEDLEAYADDLSQEDPCECLDKMASLLRVYGTVVQALGSHAVQVVTWELLSDNLHGMLNCVLHATEFAPRNALLVSANQTLGLLTDLTGECPSALVDLLELQCGLSPLSEEHALSVLRLLSVLVARLGPQLPLPLVAVAFGRRWSRSPRAKIQGALLAVQRAILRLKSVALVEEAYRCVVAALSNDAEPGPKALAAATSLGPLCALSEVANARHSIIGMWALKPAFFDLVLEHLAPLDSWLGKHQPGVQYALLHLLHSHCERHGQFVSSSVLVTGGDVLGVPSSGHLSRILTLLARVLASDEIADDARLLGLHWTVELMHAVQMHMGRVVDSPEFLGLVDAVIQSGHRCDVDMASKSCDILRAVVDTVGTCLPRSMLQRCYDLSVMKAGSICQAERSKFIALMALLPIDLIVSNLSVANLPDQASQRSAVLSAPATSLTAQGFRSVMSALLLPTHPDSAAVHPRLERLAPARLAASGRHAGLLWFWALWEAAQTCVALKLRTPLGKPQETFTSVEAALKGLLSDPLEDAASLKRAQLLIDFLEHLDKAMYNAYEGTAATLSPPPKAVRTFFRTNRATCLEWLTRVRPKAVKVALRAGRFAEALRHAWALGTPTSTWSPSSAAVGFESVLLDVAKCLVALRCPEALTGLYAYSKSALGQRIPWLKAAAAHAGGRLESAAEEYAELVFEDDTTSIKTPKDLKYFVFNQLLDCHARLSDWSGALNWMEDVVPMNGCGPIGTRALDAARHIRFLLSAARLARKQHNLRLAEHWLLLEAGCGDTVSLATLGEEGAPSPVLREGAKLLHASGRVAEAARALVRVAQTEANNPAEEELVARSLLTLAKWLQADASAVEPHLGGTLSQCRNGALVDGWQRVGPPVQPLDGLLSAPEAAVGALLQRSLLLCPSLPKAWATYAAWCYRWGRKVVDAPRRAPVATSSRNGVLCDGKLPLSAKDASDLSYILPETLTEEETNAIKHILTRVQASQACPEGGDWALGAEPGPEGAWPGLQQELEEACPHLEPRVIESLLEARSRLVGQTYQYYRASASAYIKYLQLNYQASLSTVCFSLSSTLAQVRSLVQELRRITLLWDELWLSALNVHSAEAHRRIRTLEEEVGRVRNNPSLSPAQRESLIRDKHAVFLCPTLRVLEQLQSLVSREAETPHELWFKDTLGPLIEETLSALREPADPSRPQASWAALRRLHLRLQRRPHDEGPQLLMERVSPALAQLRDSRVPMPGCSGDVRIAAVQSSIAVLPTKTKPKKLGFQGSDGRKYTFLFKGMEDLHLDERIMQLLSICNNLLARGGGGGGNVGSVAPRARHYAVTPLGSRSGLIQWLDGVTPLFALYKRWQQREAAPALRPSELFYGKLTPLLKEQGITNLDNRREWPVSVLVQTLKELMDETPRDLVARELWCASASAAHWWQTTCSFNRSTAVMSIVGYVIGLGDRHLDNVLLDLRSGEVVHIDYNVCFEKGKNLRVPEKVPFRMTPNIKAALGVTGVEGQFRLACEQVLKVLRRGRETLLTLLEAFVYDPLVDWDSGGGASPSSRLERDMAGALLAIRLRETAQQWGQNGQQLASALERVSTSLQEWHEAQASVQVAEHRLGEACAQQTLLEEALASEGKDHPLFSLPSRYHEWALVQGAQESALSALGEKLEECRHWGQLQNAAMAALASGSPPEQWRQALSAEPGLESVATLGPLAEFLQSSGQGQLLQQCEQSEEELLSLVAQLRGSLQTSLELLGTYAAIVVQCPSGWCHPGRTQHWQRWLEGLQEDFTLARCQDVIADFHHHYGVGTELAAAQAAVARHYELQGTVADCNACLVNILERRQAEGNDYLPEAQAALMSLAQGSVEEGGSCGRVGVLGALLGCLCSCSQNLLVMETAAAASGDHLPELQFWGSDWFLQDLHGQCFLAQQTAALLARLDPPAEMLPMCGVIETIYNVFAALLDLSVQFQTVILPEALKRAADTSVASLVGTLHGIAHEGPDLTELVAQTQQRVTEGATYAANPAIENLKDAFQDLLKVNDGASMNPGQMLLQGFHGLFAKIGIELANLYSTLDTIDLDWKSVDVVWSATALCVATPPGEPVFPPGDLLFVQSLLCMQQFFCGQLLSDTEEHMFGPVKHCIAAVYRNQLLGLPSLALGATLCSLLAPPDSRSEPAATRTLESLSALWSGGSPEAQAAAGALERACRRRDALRRLDQVEAAVRARLHRAQLRLAAHHWLHEEVLPNPGGQSLPARTTLLAEMRKGAQTLSSLGSALSDTREGHLSLAGAVEQRLKWAVGANPALTQTRDLFAQLVARWNEALRSLCQLSSEVCEASEALLLRESLRSRTAEALTWDAGFLALVNRCQESCMLAEAQQGASPVERQLLRLLGKPPPPQQDAGHEWVRSLLDKVATLRSEVLGKHHELMSELRSLLKSLARQEDAPVQEYLALYRRFSEQASEMVRSLLAAESPSEGAQRALADLAGMVPGVYGGLTALASAQDGIDQQKAVVRGADDTPDRKVAKDPRTGKALQERNSYAVGVWKRVKMKLDGRDPDSSKRSSVAEQVEYVIGEATRLENLALLYEGWTPWV
ncbi:fkbp-rapamycin associated protein, putative [Ixodes scapularis]|uniref:non-specific serine/threonine protein kinase n=1 Tax=Ixodes scapularis TaxID=6945 RepID=B7QF19_IXOSC|nr:fkbp-rapamycin associated protein, putative [Ixodes scapularis]|eukprot:XP_002414133.1 fkbp-rapamycin associated protein, putative [Ixodes scapularis]